MVLAKKRVVLVLLVLATLSLASPMAMVDASKTTDDFYLKVYFTTLDIEWQHNADNKVVIMHLTQGGIVKDGLNVELGKITLNIIEVLNIESLTGTVTAKYEIKYYSGEIIKGTMTGKLQNAILQEVELDGKFVGHGDMHVKGEIYLIMEGGAQILVLDGYSW